MRGLSQAERMFVLGVFLLLWNVDLSVGRPSEEPTKFTLSVAGGGSQNARAYPTLEQGKEILGRIVDAIRFGRGRFVNSVALVRNIVADKAETLVGEAQNPVPSVIVAKTDGLDQIRRSYSILDFQPVTRETVRLESEAGQAPLEKPHSKFISSILENFLKPTPLVDGIREEEKYGNSGDKFIGIGRALVGGFEGLSNLLNSIVDLPGNAIKKTSRGITSALNDVGSRIIGLN